MSAATPEPADVKVSVAMVTYNHEAFIAQAIESVLMQQTDFKYELVIGEDCSTDGTRSIVRAYGERYPGRIRLLLPERNQGMIANFVSTLNACRGQYVAILDGDDYWTSPEKLQRQVGLMDSHPECAICFHNVTVFDEDGSRTPRNFCPNDQKERSTLRDLLSTCFIQTCSVMLRNGLVTDLPDWYYQTLPGDWVLYILNALHGDIAYINQVWGAHRIHSQGMWSGASQLKRWCGTLVMFQALNAYLKFKYDREIGATMLQTALNIAECGVEQGLAQGNIHNIEALLRPQAGQLTLSRMWKKLILGRIYAKLVFLSYQKGRLAQVRRWWGDMIRYDPSWLCNRGVRSILVRSVLANLLPKG